MSAGPTAIRAEEMRPARRPFSWEAPSNSIAGLCFLRRHWPRIAILSVLLLVPCFWVKNIVFGDLGSHLYNAWLSLEIRAGRAPGLVLVTQWTNVLFDILLSRLVSSVGPFAAERIAVCAAIAIFFWGALATIRALSGRMAWWSVPLLYIVAYGWVLQNGLLNYYLSVGLSLFALGLLWEGTPVDFCVASVLLVVSWFAQPIPPVWALAAAAYGRLFCRSSRHRGVIFLGSLAGILGLRLLLQTLYRTDWDVREILFVTGADQADLFGLRYRIIYVAIVAILSILLWRRYRLEEFPGLWAPDTTLYGLVMFGIFFLPAGIWFPGDRLEYGFIGCRLSILAAVIGLAAASRCAVPKAITAAAVLVALLFAAFLYHDARRLNEWQRQSDQIVAGLPAGSRVWAYFDDQRVGNRVDSTYSVVSRSCIGRCYVYSNYEPASRQFRIRVEGRSSLAFSDYKLPFHEYFETHSGPIYVFDWCRGSVRRLCIVRLETGHPGLGDLP
jgi:hypothetical protein